jgi:hypothetical protein
LSIGVLGVLLFSHTLQVFHKFHQLQDSQAFLKYTPLLHTNWEILQVEGVVITHHQPPQPHPPHQDVIFVQLYQSILYQALHVGVLGISLLTALIVHNSHLKS